MKKIIFFLSLLLPLSLLSQSREDVSSENLDDLIAAYNTGKINGKDLLILSLRIKQNKQDSIALAVAQRAKSSWIDKQPPKSVISEETRLFISYFPDIFDIKDQIVRLMIEEPLACDQGFSENGFSQKTTDYLISKHIVKPDINTAKKINAVPDWPKTEKKITRAYGRKTAQRLILNEQLNWYTQANDWPMIINLNIQKIETQGLDTVGLGKSYLNNLIYDVILMHSTDTSVLRKAAGYMEIILRGNPNRDSWLDTYANILYKQGKLQDALKYEERALFIAQQKKSADLIQSYETILNKMRNGQPTWSGSNN